MLPLLELIQDQIKFSSCKCSPCCRTSLRQQRGTFIPINVWGLPWFKTLPEDTKITAAPHLAIAPWTTFLLVGSSWHVQTPVSWRTAASGQGLFFVFFSVYFDVSHWKRGVLLAFKVHFEKHTSVLISSRSHHFYWWLVFFFFFHSLTWCEWYLCNLKGNCLLKRHLSWCWLDCHFHANRL